LFIKIDILALIEKGQRGYRGFLKACFMIFRAFPNKNERLKPKNVEIVLL
jgi:hypothetical protein